MISSVFGKTKPINTVLVLSFLTLLFVLSCWLLPAGWEQHPFLPPYLLTILLLYSSALLIGFIVTRNQLTAAHSFALLFFSLLFACFPEALLDGQGILAAFFFYLALRRLLSMHSLRRVAAKLFDGTLWLLVASLFVKWSLVLLVLIPVFLIAYEPKNFRSWLVPLAAAFVFLSIAWGVCILAGAPQALWDHYRSWGGELLKGPGWRGFNLIQGLYLVLLSAAAAISLVKLGKSGHGTILRLQLLVAVVIVALGLAVVWKPFQQGSLLFTFFPAAIFFSRFTETLRRQKWRDLWLWGFFVLSLLAFAWQVIIK